MPSFLELPAELIIRFLAELGYEELLSCKQTCKLLNETVDTNTQLQYIIELAINGMEDSGLNSCLLALKDRLRLLKDRHDRWINMRYSSITKIPAKQSMFWGFTGGILSQSDEANSFMFTQLPSKFRGVDVEERTWVLKDLPFRIFNSTCDPAQDLLVAVEMIRESWIKPPLKIHLRSLTTGEVHQEAVDPGYLTFSMSAGMFSKAYFRLSGTYVGVLCSSEFYRRKDLTIRNWRTGDVLLYIYSLTILGFIFLTDHLIMIIHDAEDSDEPILSVMDFKKPSRFIYVEGSRNNPSVLEDQDFELSFELPAIHPEAEFRSIDIRSDPAPSWTPHPNLKLPFHATQNDRLLVITIHTRSTIRALLLFLPTSTVMHHLADTLAGKTEALLGEQNHRRPGRRLDWEDWGPTGTRMIIAPPSHELSWVWYVSGMTYASLSQVDGCECVHLLDFNPSAIRDFRNRALRPTGVEVAEDSLQEHHEENSAPIDTSRALSDLPEHSGSESDNEDDWAGSGTRVVDEDIFIKSPWIFDSQTVKTSLPFLSRKIPIPALPDRPDTWESSPYALMLGEDAVVLVYGVS